MNNRFRKKAISSGKTILGILSDAYKPLAAGALVLAVSVYVLDKVFGIDPQSVKFWFAASICIFILIFVSLFVIPALWHDRRARRHSRNPNIKILELNISLILRENNKILYRLDYVIEPLEKNVEGFNRRITWSGPIENISIQSCYGGSVEFMRVGDRPGTDCYFRFNPIPVKNVEIAFGFEILIDDPQKLVRRYVGDNSVYLPERLLKLKLTDETVEHCAFCQSIYQSVSDVSAHGRENCSAGSTNSHEWEIEGPEHGKVYTLQIVD